jgi:hypothetical protein
MINNPKDKIRLSEGLKEIIINKYDWDGEISKKWKRLIKSMID